jgi:hypothetical protein
VILVPAVMGVSDLELGFGASWSSLATIRFVADLFGKKFRGAERDVMFGEMGRLKGDRAALRGGCWSTSSSLRAGSTRSKRTGS